MYKPPDPRDNAPIAQRSDMRTIWRNLMERFHYSFALACATLPIIAIATIPAYAHINKEFGSDEVLERCQQGHSREQIEGDLSDVYDFPGGSIVGWLAGPGREAGYRECFPEE
jgi:hypothetical protein